MADDQRAQSPNASPSPKKPEINEARQFKVPGYPGFQLSPNGEMQMFPTMYPALVPGLMPLHNQEQSNNGAGIYAVPVVPFMGAAPGVPPNTLIPLTYNIPTRMAPVEDGTVSEENGQEARQQRLPQRQVARRFHAAFQIDLLLILKLAAFVFVFNQDGSRQRLFLLVFFAVLIYLYRTGTLTPLIRWLSQGMHRAAAPPQGPHQQVAARGDNNPAALRPDGENAARAEGQAGVDNTNEQAENENQAVENANQVEAGRGNGINWWVVVKEIQMIVVGFLTSLLPGFHNVD
ncbi:hypothetical protein Scep_023188 [Stephania cephalantha]|uniref:Transmembrane protein n=1 Tax=Stephania cephalantha TaxID=152367 RepID=A0AAP0F1B3_9MAGN